MLVEAQNTRARGCMKKNEFLSTNNPLIGGQGEWKGCMLGNSLRKAPFFILAKKRMRKRRPGRAC